MSTRLGAVVIGEPIVMDDGRIGHAELALGGGMLYLADEYPEIGMKAPAPQADSVMLDARGRGYRQCGGAGT